MRHAPPIRPGHRHIVLGALLAAAALCWATLLAYRAAPAMAMADSPTMGLSAPAFLAIWVIMMVAMMFPSAAPMVLTYQAVQASRRTGAALLPTTIFIAGYMLVWTLAGAVAYAAARGVEVAAARAALSRDMAARIGGALLLLAGLYQLTPLKDACLETCRTPVAFIMHGWRAGLDGAVRMGVRHGLYCLGCCWLLFVILFPLGIMNLAAMAVLTVLICAEKMLPRGRLVARVIAVGLVAYGGLALAVPGVLPGHADAPPTMTMPMP